MAHARFGRYDSGVLLGSGIYLYFNLFSLEGTPFLLGGDEQVFWMNALRMLRGELPYRDFFEFTPPGADLVYFGAFTLLGPRVWAPNVVQLILGITLSWLCFRIARSILKPAQAALTAALFITLDFGKWLDATHHWFSLLAVLASLAILMSGGSSTRVLISGALLGLASFFTQTRGVGAALGIAGFLLWDGFRTKAPWRNRGERQLQLLFSFVLMWAILSSYFIFRVGISRLLYFQVTYVLHYVTDRSHNLYPKVHDALGWPIYVLVCVGLPIVYAYSLWRCRKAARDASPPDVRRIALLAFAGLGMFLEVAQSPNSLRVDSIAAPGMILSVWLMAGWAGQMREYAPLRKFAPTLIWVGLICLGARQIWHRNVERAVILDLPAGRTAMSARTSEELAWLARRTAPGEFFFQSSYQSLYLPLALRNPAFDFLDRYTSPEFVDEDIRRLQATRVRYILWSPLDQPRFPKYEQFLVERYRRIWTFSDQDEIWELK
jgi:hypothetical protein